MVIGVIKDHKSRQSASMILMQLYLEGKWEKFYIKVLKNLEYVRTRAGNKPSQSLKFHNPVEGESA